MRISVPFKNTRNGKINWVAVGTNSGVMVLLVFFLGFFGLPLFIYRLYKWGAVFLVLDIAFIAANIADKPILGLLVLFLIFILSIWMGRNINKMTAQNYLQQGWVFAEPSSAATQTAKKQWKMD